MEPRLDTKPIIVQGDMSVLLEVQHAQFEEARDAMATFAELIKSPEYMHTYRITPLSLWNAASSGITAETVLEQLRRYSKHALPPHVERQILDYGKRYGKVQLVRVGDALRLRSDDPYALMEIEAAERMQPYLLGDIEGDSIEINSDFRGHVKQALIHIGYPVEDLAGYADAARFSIALCEQTRSGEAFQLREYQKMAVDSFYAGGHVHGGSGVIVLPCGAGKTIVGIAAMARVGAETLILTTSIAAVHQWKNELLDKTDISESMIGEYSGERKEIRPVTIGTYNILTHRDAVEEAYPHLELFRQRNFGLIVYDEVHLLPAPVFRITAEIQSKRRLGLTATLVREDGKESDVFSLIGPKKCDVPWKVLEKQEYISEAFCYEVRVPLPDALRMPYAVASGREKFRIASENPAKQEIVQALLQRHARDNVLIIGQYIEQLQAIAALLGAPLITGKLKNADREALYTRFRTGEERVLVVSKVANFAIDLPDANVAIEISGTYGSRQEESQRLGRILRPKPGDNRSWFYTLVSSDTREQEFAMNRQLFLTEQGYRYEIVDAWALQEAEEGVSDASNTR